MRTSNGSCIQRQFDARLEIDLTDQEKGVYQVTKELKELLELAKKVKLTEKEKEEQRISFAWGNTHFENKKITKEMVARESKKLFKDRKAKNG